MNEAAPYSFMVTDSDLDAPDGALIYLEEHDAWYERALDWWYQVPEPDIV